MPKVLRMTDRCSLTIKDVVFIWGPLSEKQRIEIRTATKIRNGQEVTDVYLANSLLLKYTLKEIKGLKDFHGDDYKLELIDGVLTDDCLSEVRSIEYADQYITAAWDMMETIPDKLTDSQGNELEGVALELLPKVTQSG